MFLNAVTLATALLAVPVATNPGATRPPQATARPERNEPRPATIEVIGTAALKPDEAEIDVGVTTQASKPQVAVERNATRLTRVLDELKARFGSRATFETKAYSLTPEYRYPEEGGEPAISGYRASNVIRVTLSDLHAIGALIDAAVSAGANQAVRLQYALENPESVRARVLRTAARRAWAEAEALASALGVKIVRVLTVSEHASGARPVHDVTTLSAEASAATTPIEAGAITVDARVVSRWRLKPGR